jgi:hypothetical protein
MIDNSYQADLTDFTIPALLSSQAPIYFYLFLGNSFHPKEKGPNDHSIHHQIDRAFLLFVEGFFSIGPVLVPRLLFFSVLSLTLSLPRER